MGSLTQTYLHEKMKQFKLQRNIGFKLGGGGGGPKCQHVVTMYVLCCFQSVVDAEVAILLGLKTKLKGLTGEEAAPAKKGKEGGGAKGKEEGAKAKEGGGGKAKEGGGGKAKQKPPQEKQPSSGKQEGAKKTEEKKGGQ